MPHQQPYLRDQHDYPSPAPSDPSPGPRSLDLYASPSADSMVGSFSQIDSNIGPARSTRSRPSLSRQGTQPRRLSLLSSGLRESDGSLQSPGPHLSETLLPRTDSPTLDRFENRSPILHSNSPTLYQPNTPVSVPSPFSHYDQARRSRTRSMDKGDFRTHSPALSNHSGQTSHSSSRGFDVSQTHADPIRDTKPKKKERHHKHKLRDQDRKAICVYHIEHPNARQEDIGSAFGVERSTISKILKDKDRWLNISDEDPGNETTGKHRPSKFPEVEFEMMKSLQAWSDRGENITDQLIRSRALEIAKSFGMPPEKFKGSSGWIENFKHRHDIRRGEWLKASNRANNAAANGHGLGVGGGINGSIGGGLNGLGNVGIDGSSTTGLGHHQTSSGSPLSPYEHRSSSDENSSSSSLMIDPALQAQSSSSPHILTHPSSLSSHQNSQSQHSPLAPIQHSPTVTYGVHFGASIISTRAPPPPPTLAEAETAVNLVLDYIDRGDQQIAKDDEREVLTRLKVAMFQRVGSIPYER